MGLFKYLSTLIIYVWGLNISLSLKKPNVKPGCWTDMTVTNITTLLTCFSHTNSSPIKLESNAMDCAILLLFNQTCVELKHHSCLLLLFIFNNILL